MPSTIVPVKHLFPPGGWGYFACSTSFEETLRYQNPLFSATDALPGKAGLITEWVMQQKGGAGTGGTSTHTTYAFSYDKAGRLTNSLRYVEPSMIGTVTLAERDITYDASGNLLTLKRYGNSSTTPIDSLSYSYDGPKRIGWSYDPNGNVTSDATNGVSIDWNVIDLPRAITSGTSSTQRFYLADGTLSHIQDGTQMRIFLGDIVFKISPGSFGIESAGWEGGRLLPGTGNDKVLYYVNDHLGSVRVVKNGNGFIKQRFDYYPYGSVSRGWWGELGADNPEKRYRFGGKEIAGTASNATATGSDTYLDFGARLYSPRTALWMSQDSMAEKYYRMTPYLYCSGNPVNVVDPEGRSWYYSIIDGSFVAHIDDGDDLIYLLSQEQIDTANGDLELLQSYRTDENLFGHLALEGLLDKTVAYNVISSLFNIANKKEENGEQCYIAKPRIQIEMGNSPNGEEASSTSKALRVYLKEDYYRGYDVINLFAHEIGHFLHRQNKAFKDLSASDREREADRFAKHHWSSNKTSQRRLEAAIQHAKENGYNWYDL